MDDKKLLYELEYEVNELRNIKLNEIRYEKMSIKELLDLGFDNTFIKINNQWFNLGYKWKAFDNLLKNYKYGYESSDFGELTEQQLNCIICYIDDELNDYNYLQVNVGLVNEEDSKYFVEV